MLLSRLFASRCREKLKGDSVFASNQSDELRVVERAMHNIGRDAAPAFKSAASQLNKFLSMDD